MDSERLYPFPNPQKQEKEKKASTTQDRSSGKEGESHPPCLCRRAEDAHGEDDEGCGGEMD
jgi:hypothetical protein